MIYDITRTVSPESAVWPGDTPPELSNTMRLDAGDSVNLLRIAMSPHTGTHADAFYHFEPNGNHPATMPLDAYIGRARVVTVQKQDGPLTPADFDHLAMAGSERLLIHSHISDLNDDQFSETFPYLSVELIAWLASLNFRLIGLDSPSVDAFDSKDLPCHHALYQHQIVNLENLYLRDVPDGEYKLVALPLKLDRLCGSPVRAMLRPLDKE